MIKKFILHNIESHVHSEIDLKMGINAFIGSSDSGKSSVIRCLRSFLYFTPLIARFDEPECYFEIHTDKGILGRYRTDIVKYKCENCNKQFNENPEKCECGSTDLTTKRKKKIDEYRIYGKVFEKMSTGFKNLSEEIVKEIPFLFLDITKTNPIAIGFKEQEDPFLWDGLSATAFSRMFSYLEGNDYLHLMSMSVKKEIMEDKRLISVLTPDVLALSEKVTESEFILEDKLTMRAMARSAKDCFSKLLTEHTYLFTIIEDYDRIINKGKKLKQNIEAIPKSDTGKLELLLEEYDFLISNVTDTERLTDKITSLETTDITEQAISIEVMEEWLEEHKWIVSNIKSFKSVSQTISALDINLKHVDKELAGLDLGFKKEIIDAGICPFSGYVLQESCKSKILEEYGNS